MNKKQLFYKYTDWSNLQGIGAGWVSQIKGYLPIGEWIQKSAGYQVVLWALNIHMPYWIIITLIVLKFYVMIFVNWFLGKFVIKVKLYEAQQQYNAKTEHLSPYNREVINTLEEICKATGAKSKFTKL